LPNTVLFIVDSLGLSGKTQTLSYVASHLDRNRFQGAVCSFSAERCALSDQLAERGIPVHSLPTRDGLDFGLVLRLARLIRSARANVVHCYNPRPILYGGLAARALGIRATIGSLSAFACHVPDRSYGFLPQPLSTVSRRNVYRNKMAAHLMRRLVAVSPSLGARFCEYNGLPLDKLSVVPYGTDLSAVERVTPAEVAALRQQLGFAPDNIVIGSIGRLVEQKDYPTQLKAFALAATQVPQLRMVLAGDGPLESALRCMVTDLNLHDRVRFLGHWEQVPLLLRSLDIFVLSSKFEPYGVALLEAKGAGLPIVATRVNEIPEILAHGASGLLSPPGDPEGIAQLMVMLAKDSGLRARLGQRALAEARERHSLESVVSSYQNLYESALN
jgi:glycosyltransferase involved in cell wall biosynthesis